MRPKLENTNPEAIRRIREIASADPELLIDQTGRIAEAIKYNLPLFTTDEVEQLIADFRNVDFPPLASLPMDELGSFLATYITDKPLAAHIASFEAIEAVFLVFGLEFYFAWEQIHPGQPATLETYVNFFPIEGIDQEV